MNQSTKYIINSIIFAYIGYKASNVSSLKKLFRIFKRMTYIDKLISNGMKNTINEIKIGLIQNRFHNVKPNKENALLQDDPLDKSEIMVRINEITNYNKSDYKISGAVYADESKWGEMVGEIYSKTAWLNPTHVSIWPELIQMEADIYSMCCKLFKSNRTNAILTPGGTMSIIQAMYTYRNKYLIEKNITCPNIVAPNTAHTSFRKACQILNIEYRLCDVDYKTGKADIKSMSNLIDPDTICLIGSAPSFAYGIIDPISEIADLANKNNIGFHLDCCLGGFQVPFIDLEEKCDFSVSGVTSISADPHKFGQTPKGISILMFRSNTIKNYLTFVDINWTGGMYVAPDFFGSRAGSNIAILWAIMKSIGCNGYIDSTFRLINIRESIEREIYSRFNGFDKFNNDIYIHGKPLLSTFGIKSDKFNIHFINKKMTEYGWEFNVLPDGLHFCITEKHLLYKDTFITEFIDDLEKSIKYIKNNPSEDPGKTANIYCSVQKIPDFADDLLEEIGKSYIEVQTMVGQ
jgi:sphinganine-1-phosphate aldolase